MRRWAALTAVLTIPYGIAFLVHERPVTGGHALAGLGIIGLGIFLLGAIAAMSRQPSRTNAIWLLVFQGLTTAAAITALLLQRLPFTTATLLALVAFSIPLVASVRRFRPDSWQQKPLTDRTMVVDLVVETVLVVGAVALMIVAHSIRLIPFVLGGIVSMVMTAYTLRVSRSLARFER